MSFHRGRRNHRPAPPPRRFRFDALEARDVPATIPPTPPGNTLSGHVWIDENNDGIQDPSETPRAQAVVWMSGHESESDTNIPVLFAQTDANGLYRFTGLNQGTYSVHIGGIRFYIPGKASVGGFGGTVIPDGVADIVLPGGWQEAGGYNLPLVEPTPPPASRLSGLVWLDENNDGVRDPGEKAQANVQVALTGPDNTVTSDTIYATTDANGLYRFTIVEPGYYSVKVGSVPDYQPGKVSAGAFGGTVSGGEVSRIYVPTLIQDSGGYNFPLVQSVPPQPPGNTLAGLAYHDLDNDGWRLPSEPGVANVQVTLTGTEAGTNTSVQRTTTTDAHGIYRFTGLNQGTYSVQVGQVPAYTIGKSFAGAFGGTPLPGSVSDIPLPGGWAKWGGYNFGLVETVPSAPPGPGNKISGIAWHDRNNDGVRDLNEESLPGLELALHGTEAGTGQTVFLTARTDANGIYRFTGLKPGTYSIMTGPIMNGFVGGKTSVGAFGGTPNTGGIGGIDLPGGWPESGGYNIGMVALA